MDQPCDGPQPDPAGGFGAVPHAEVPPSSKGVAAGGTDWGRIEEGGGILPPEELLPPPLPLVLILPNGSLLPWGEPHPLPAFEVGEARGTADELSLAEGCFTIRGKLAGSFNEDGESGLSDWWVLSEEMLSGRGINTFIVSSHETSWFMFVLPQPSCELINFSSKCFFSESLISSILWKLGTLIFPPIVLSSIWPPLPRDCII